MLLRKRVKRVELRAAAGDVRRFVAAHKIEGIASTNILIFLANQIIFKVLFRYYFGLCDLSFLFLMYDATRLNEPRTSKHLS